VVCLYNSILATEIFCNRYSTINNSAMKWYFSTKFGDRFSNLLGIKCTEFYLDLFKFAFFIVRCLGGYFCGHYIYAKKTAADKIGKCLAQCRHILWPSAWSRATLTPTIAMIFVLLNRNLFALVILLLSLRTFMPGLVFLHHLVMTPRVTHRWTDRIGKMRNAYLHSWTITADFIFYIYLL